MGSTPKTTSEIREAFLGFFESKGHQRVSSGPLVPANDPTLMFANAGMNQFKDVFTGRESRDYKRATSSQKCIRISGKHNDLENVGVSARHHTFFEMLGNFSFGDYFKKEAIAYAWEFVTQTLGIDPARLAVSVFKGDNGVPADEEAVAIWRETTGLSEERIFRCPAKDNFWQMGDTGPCGPCSEIFYWSGPLPADLSKFDTEPDEKGVGWMEFWNLVFMQFDRAEDGTLTPLPAPCVDTGMGLERISALCQNEYSTYHTEDLQAVVDLAAQIAGKKYARSQSADDASMRVIADHARTTAFLIAEGVFPDRDGRPYVLRRVMRRAIRHGHRLGITEPFLHRAALCVVDHMKEAYPELQERRALIEDITRQEEERFRRTLKRGLDLLADNDEWEEQDGKKLLPGRVAFTLYDTFGFPVDLQDVIGEEEGFLVDHVGFARALDEARLRSAGSKVGERAVDEVVHTLREEFGDTAFVGYETEVVDGAKLLAIVANGEKRDEIRAGTTADLVFDKTPFYAESGGQVGDIGDARAQGVLFEVTDAQKPLGGLFLHHGKLKEGTLRVGDSVALFVDSKARSATRRNHSATHLMHWALRQVVGDTALQKGSLVGPDRLRFDYASSKPLTASQITQIEDLVNEAILENTPVTTELLSMEDAKAKGAIGIFEEKYGSEVRVLTIGPSLELCGGTHAARTGDIGSFRIRSEAGLAAGVRRIEAATGLNVIRDQRLTEEALQGASHRLKAAPNEVGAKIDKLLEVNKEQQKEIERLGREMMRGGDRDLAAEAKEVDGIRFLGSVVPLGDPKALRELADQLRDKLAPAVILLGAEGKNGKALLACSVSKEATSKYKAGDIIREAAQVVGGGGGGRPDFAQAGGKDPSKLGEAVQQVYPLTSA